MKEIYKNTSILLIFFLIFLFKESIYGLLIKINNLDELDSRITEIKETYYEKEYKNIMRSLDLMSSQNFDYTYSKVLYRDIYDYFNEFTILKGKENKIKNNSAVVNEKGLIGVIKKVDKNSSVVTLITNKDSQISIEVNNSFGILKYENNNLVIKSINNYEDIEIGDKVMTSGIANLPKGINIGTVSKVINNSLGIEKTIVVIPAVDFEEINYVAIIEGMNIWFYCYYYLIY